MQAEQFANEITRHLDICAPMCRIVREVSVNEVWGGAHVTTTEAFLVEHFISHPHIVKL